MNKIIYYYQTFNGLDNIIDNPNTYVTDIIISSIHFGYNLENPYIHLNNYNLIVICSINYGNKLYY